MSGDISAGQPVSPSAVRAGYCESSQQTCVYWQKQIDAAHLRQKRAVAASEWDVCIAMDEELVKLQDMFVRSRQEEWSTMDLYDTKIKDVAARLQTAVSNSDFQSCKDISAELETLEAEFAKMRAGSTRGE